MTFKPPIAILNHAPLSTVDDALQYLTVEWGGEKSPLHRDAVETCLKVKDGHRSTIDAQKAVEAFVASVL